MTDLDALISEIEQNEPSRELDLRIAVALGQCDPSSRLSKGREAAEWYEYHPEVPGGADELQDWQLPHYTTNLQDATLVVPEGWQWGKRVAGEGTFMECYPPDHLEQTGLKGAFGDRRTYAATRSWKEDAKALTLAALRAIKEKEG